MLKLVFKYILPLSLLLVVAIVGYNYFYGTLEEQESSKQIIDKVKGLGTDVFDLLASEKEKFDAGKYDDAIDKVGSSLSYLKDKVSTMSGDGRQFLGQLQELETEKQELEGQLAAQNNFPSETPTPSVDRVGHDNNSRNARDSNNGALTVEQIQARINQLAQRTEKLGLEIESQSEQ